MEPEPSELSRISIVGTTGSGKTMLARALSQRLGVPHVELDALNWEPRWREAKPDIFRGRVTNALHDERWITDGNYRVVRPIIWERADTVVWLDYPLPLIMNRLVRRTARRVATNEHLWGSNYERLSSVFGKDSLVLWAMKSHRRRRREYPQWIASYPHLTVYRLRSPRETQDWFCSLPMMESGTLNELGA